LGFRVETMRATLARKMRNVVKTKRYSVMMILEILEIPEGQCYRKKTLSFDCGVISNKMSKCRTRRKDNNRKWTKSRNLKVSNLESPMRFSAMQRNAKGIDIFSLAK